MAKQKLTADEILAAEKAKDERVQSRKLGFGKMSERDRGYARLNEYQNRSEVYIRWDLPTGKFMLDIRGKDGKQYVFDVEEFRRSLRWA